MSAHIYPPSRQRVAKLIAAALFIMVWILIDKGNAAGQSIVRLSEATSAKGEPLLTEQALRHMTDRALTTSAHGGPASPSAALFKDGRDPEEGDGEEGDFGIYPNPVEDDMVFDFEFTVRGSVPYDVSDVQGRTLIQGTVAEGVAQHKVSLSELPRGIYLVRAQMGSRVVIKRVMKK